MTGNPLAAAPDHHLVHVALHQHVAMPILGRHRVVVGAIAYQRQRTHPRHPLLASFIRADRQWQEGRSVPRKAFSDRLRFTTNPTPPAPPALPPPLRHYRL